MKTVSEVMTHRPTAILQSATIRAAIATMTELDVRHLPVVNADHELVGMLSDRDIRSLGPNQAGAVTTIMSSDVLSVEATEELTEVIEIMLENRVGAVPIVNTDRKLVGIVSYLDILRVYLAELQG